MRNLYLKVIFCLLINAQLIFGLSFNPEVDSLLLVLDERIENYKVYDNQKEQRICALKEMRVEAFSLEEEYRINNKIVREVINYNFDSTLHYLQRNIDIAELLDSEVLAQRTKVKLSGLLCNTGRVNDAIQTISQVSPNGMDTLLLIDYYRVKFGIANILKERCATGASKLIYTKEFNAQFDTLISLLPKGSIEELMLQQTKYTLDGNIPKALEINDQLLLQVDIKKQHLYSKILFLRASYNRTYGRTNTVLKCFALSAIYDIKFSQKQHYSIVELATSLYINHDLERANNYVNFAIQSNAIYNSPYRSRYVSSISPLITDAYLNKIAIQKKNLRIYSLILLTLSLLLLVFVFYIFSQNKKLRIARKEIRLVNNQLRDLNNKLRFSNENLNKSNNTLNEANHIKEKYIGVFLSICSNYINKLDAFRKKVNKDIGAHHFDELFKETRSHKMIDDELQEFYSNFDKTFLSIIPHFVEGLNALLIPEEQITLKSEELLNTELRIFALIRLGISDSSKIAELLRYSPTTIYNYRSKFKNKALGNRSDLESDIMTIDTALVIIKYQDESTKN